MTRTPAPVCRVLLSGIALDDAIEAGRTALPRETGGILIGFREGPDIVVTRLLVVQDGQSSGHTYLRSERGHRRR